MARVEAPAGRSAAILIGLLLALGFGFPTHHEALAQSTAGERLPVVERTLDNGMRVLVLERRGSPVVAAVVRYRVGGVNETRGNTGIAHLLEHMLFKGTSRLGTTDVAAERALFDRMDPLHDRIRALRGEMRPDTATIRALEERIRSLEDSARAYVEANEFDRILSTNGARGLNATTDWEATTYFVELPANRLELWFALERERMSDPVFREFYSERDVVAEERRLRVDTQPDGLLAEAHLAAAFTVHPYGQPVVGTMTDIRNLRREDVRDYYRRFYGPNNAVVTIVGDVDASEVAGWAETYFADLPAGETPPPLLAREPEQRGERRIEIRFDAEPAVKMGWHVVDAGHEDLPALTMLSSLLTGGRTSILFKRLVVEQRIAAGVSSYIGPGSRYPQLFTIDATPLSPHTTGEMEAAIYAELDRLSEELVPETDLQRIRNQYEAGQFRRLTSNLGLAFQLADSEALFDDWRATFRFSTRVREVTSTDVRRVVRTYFAAENRTVATRVKSSGGSP